MNLNFKDVLSSVLGAGKNKANEFQGSNGRIAKGLTRGRSNRQYERSIHGRSENLTLQFPIVVTDSLSNDAVEVIRNQVELERSVDISTVVSNTPVVNMTGSNGYLDGYHNNVYMGNNSPLSTATESASSFIKTNEELLESVDDYLEKKSLNTRTLPVDLLNQSLSESMPGAHPGSKVNIDDDVKEGKTPLVSVKKSAHVSIKPERLNRSIPLLSRVKINYAIKDPENHNKTVGTIENKEVVFGVKGVVHLVPSSDVIYFLGDASKRSNALARLIKLTTGEISFFREFLLNTDRSLKIAKSKKSSVWNTMNSMFTVEKMNQYRGKKDGMIPTITLAVSIDEIENIRIKTGIDILNNKRAAATIFDELFLLDFYIVDEVNQIAHKYIPREGYFEPFTLGAMSGKDLNDRNKANNSAEDLLKRLLSNKH